MTENKKHWTSFSEIWPTVGFSSGWSSLIGKVLYSERFCLLIMRFIVRPSLKRKITLFFNKSIFNYQIIERSISFDQNDSFLQDIEFVNLLFSYFSARFWSFKCNISSFCVCHHCYRYCVLQYVPLSEKFLIFY